MKKSFIICLTVVVITLLTGCGEQKPVGATSSPVTTTNSPEAAKPTEQPIATVTQTVVVEPQVVDFIEINDTKLLDDDRAYFTQLEQTHIRPYLNGYSIVEKYIEYTGNKKNGYEEYRVTYVCRNGRKEIEFIFRASQMAYYADKVNDNVYYDVITIEVEGELSLIHI